MTAHPGHPVIGSGDGLSASRNTINDAFYKVKTTTVATTVAALDVTVDGTHILADADSGPITLSLPDFTVDATALDVEFVFVKIDASVNAVTIDTVGAPTINGAATTTLTSQWDGVTIWNDGSQWYIRK